MNLPGGGVSKRSCKPSDPFNKCLTGMAYAHSVHGAYPPVVHPPNLPHQRQGVVERIPHDHHVDKARANVAATRVFGAPARGSLVAVKAATWNGSNDAGRELLSTDTAALGWLRWANAAEVQPLH